MKFIFSEVLFELFNFYIDNKTFLNGLKKADIKPANKKDDPFDKTNYRPVSILPLLYKAFERCLCVKSMNILILYYQKFNAASE